MKHFLILLIQITLITHCFSQSEKSNATNKASITDSIHVAHYAISIDAINFDSKSIGAHTQLKVFSKLNNLKTVTLSLMQLQVDSIVSNRKLLAYHHAGETLRITTPQPLHKNDSIELTVYYHGHPAQDVTGWGGFYFKDDYAYNMGIGFGANPHTVGKMWFPCVDEFTDRATYDFHITTASTSKAFCNGALVSQTKNANGSITWHWSLAETIPTYLACIAVAPFYTLQQNVAGIPVELALMANDSSKVISSIEHLPIILKAFINTYGKYPFNKVGFSLVPFNSGAMEHASQITIGKSYFDGTLKYETLWAHELSHAWWGDLVTCETASDMWLNEGWASFNEAFALQSVYGDTTYKDWIRNNHRKVLQSAHIKDGSYLSYANVPHAYTYGTTVYSKGADAVYTLRNYLGDSLFFAACKYHLNKRAYGSSNSYQLRDDISIATGIDMTRFFDDWIFTAGFPHFSIDSCIAVAPYQYAVYLRQRSKGNTHLYKMPIELNLTNGVNDTTVTVVSDAATQKFLISISFEPIKSTEPYIQTKPIWIAIDRNEKISDAISDCEKIISKTGAVEMPQTNVKLLVQDAGAGNTIVRIEHNWVAPDKWKQNNQGIRLSNYHYWKVDGIWDTAFLSKAEFTINGSTKADGYLDNSLITGTEDSLLVLWRANTADDWHFIAATFDYGTDHNDKKCTAIINNLRKGEYTLGYYDYKAGIAATNPDALNLNIKPDTEKQVCRFNFDLKNATHAVLQVADSKGKVAAAFPIFSNQNFIDWDYSDASSGKYVAKLCIDSGLCVSEKFDLK